jgi:hypothetical protein
MRNKLVAPSFLRGMDLMDIVVFAVLVGLGSFVVAYPLGKIPPTTAAYWTGIFLAVAGLIVFVNGPLTTGIDVIGALGLAGWFGGMSGVSDVKRRRRHLPAKYRERRIILCDKDVATFVSSPAPEDDRQCVIRGACPRCHHETSATTPDPFPIAMTCACDETHPRTPDGEHGCGASWLLPRAASNAEK